VTGRRCLSIGALTTTSSAPRRQTHRLPVDSTAPPARIGRVADWPGPVDVEDHPVVAGVLAAPDTVKRTPGSARAPSGPVPRPWSRTAGPPPDGSATGRLLALRPADDWIAAELSGCRRRSAPMHGEQSPAPHSRCLRPTQPETITPAFLSPSTTMRPHGQSVRRRDAVTYRNDERAAVASVGRMSAAADGVDTSGGGYCVGRGRASSRAFSCTPRSARPATPAVIGVCHRLRT